MRSATERTAPPPGAHVADFSDDTWFPAVPIARHIATGLNTGSPAIVMATPPHAAAIARVLGPGAVAVTWLDAGQTLNDVLVRSKPDATRFDRVVGEVVRSATSDGAPAYVYGEMVDLLTQRGQLDAALALEDLWTRLAATAPLHLYCTVSSRRDAGDSTDGVVFQAPFDHAWTNGRAHDELANIASHELRNPVHVLSLNVRAARTALDMGAPASSVRHQLESAEAQLARVTSLLDRMLRSSGFLDERVELAPSEFDLADVVRSVLDSMQHQLATSKLTVDLRSVVGYWDRDRVEQIVENLVSHVLTFGGGQPIRVSLQEFPEFVYLSVCDSGIADNDDAPVRPAAAESPRDPSSFDFRLWAARQLSEALGGTIATSRPSPNQFRLILTLPRGFSRGETAGRAFRPASAMSA